MATILDLPVCMLSEIFSYLTYHEIAKNRIVCKVFDDVGKESLNRGFGMVQRRHHAYLLEIKSKLPRRDSERCGHPLVRHNDILLHMDTRLAILKSAFHGWIEKGYCCFVPGKIIDEVLHLLRILKADKMRLPPAPQFLLELRDLSCMAIEHFRERITHEYVLAGPPDRDGGMYDMLNKIKKETYRQGMMQRSLLTRYRNLHDDMVMSLKINTAQTRKIAKIKQKMAVLKKKLEKYERIEATVQASSNVPLQKETQPSSSNEKNATRPRPDAIFRARPTIIKRRNPIVFNDPKRPRVEPARSIPVVEYIRQLVDANERDDIHQRKTEIK